MKYTIYAIAIALGFIQAHGKYTFDKTGNIRLNRITKTSKNLGHVVDKALVENKVSWQFLGEGMDQTILTIAKDPKTGTLYAGGRFASAGSTYASCIAKWNGNQWEPLGIGLDMNGVCHDMAIDHNGNLYVAGQFMFADSKPANNVAMWDGKTWHDLNGGCNNTCEAIIVDKQNNVYVTGAFSKAGNTQASYVAKWNGKYWLPLGQGLSGPGYAIGADEWGKVYVAGEFNEAGSQAANGIAQWNGSTWQNLGNGVKGKCMDLEIHHSNAIYISGVYKNKQANGEEIFITKWDGKAWNHIHNGYGHLGDVISLDPMGNLYASGSYINKDLTEINYMAKWDGVCWLPVKSKDPFKCHDLLIDADNLVAAGVFSNTMTASQNGIAKLSLLEIEHKPLPRNKNTEMASVSEPEPRTNYMRKTMKEPAISRF